jgi:Fe-S cluster assembly protein SufD
VALARFQELGFPSIRDENWKYSSTKKLSRVDFMHRAEGAVAQPARFGEQASTARLVFVDGHFRPSASSLGSLPDGVTVEPLSEALRRYPEAVRPLIERGEGSEEPFSALSTAFMQDGVVFRVGRGVQLQEPVFVQFVIQGDGDPVVCHPRNFVVLERLARACLVETYDGRGEARQLTNTLTEISLAEGARLDHVFCASAAEAGWMVGRTRIRQERDSHYVTHGLWARGAWSRHDVEVELAGSGSTCELHGLYAPTGSEHVDVHTTVDHAVPHCTSRELYKGVLGGRSRGVFNGRVLMRHGAVGSDSDQANRNLLLSPRADVNTKPELEIYNDDVKAAHGTTVGQSDPQQLFYLRSRGLSEFDARRLLTSAFAADVVRSVAHEGLREEMVGMVSERLGLLHRLEMS